MEELLLRIKKEISDDPMNVGYAGKTDAEIMVLINSPQVVSRVVETTLPSPINRILSGLSEAPNIVQTKDVTDAKK
jgi:hypothetical protein